MVLVLPVSRDISNQGGIKWRETISAQEGKLKLRANADELTIATSQIQAK